MVDCKALLEYSTTAQLPKQMISFRNTHFTLSALFTMFDMRNHASTNGSIFVLLTLQWSNSYGFHFQKKLVQDSYKTSHLGAMINLHRSLLWKGWYCSMKTSFTQITWYNQTQEIVSLSYKRAVMTWRKWPNFGAWHDREETSTNIEWFYLPLVWLLVWLGSKHHGLSLQC